MSERNSDRKIPAAPPPINPPRVPGWALGGEGIVRVREREKWREGVREGGRERGR